MSLRFCLGNYIAEDFMAEIRTLCSKQNFTYLVDQLAGFHMIGTLALNWLN